MSGETVAKESGGSTLLAQVSALLGVGDPSALASLGLEDLRKFTHSQLLESSRTLGLSGISRLNKGDLALRLVEALQAAGHVPRRPVDDMRGLRARKFDMHRSENRDAEANDNAETEAKAQAKPNAI